MKLALKTSTKMLKLEKVKTLTESLFLELDTLNLLNEIRNTEKHLLSLKHRHSELLITQDSIRRNIATKQQEIEIIDEAKGIELIGDVEITLIRHAESEFNVLESSGSTAISERQNDRDLNDCGITAKGIQQCKELQFDKPFDVILISPMRRCQETLRYSNIRYHSLCQMDILYLLLLWCLSFTISPTK